MQEMSGIKNARYERNLSGIKNARNDRNLSGKKMQEMIGETFRPHFCLIRGRFES